MGPTLVILAAGVGTRFGGLKQLTPVGPGGEALLEYSAFDARRAGFGRLVLVVRPETEAEFRQRLDSGLGRRMPVAYAHQRLDDLPSDFETPRGRVKPWGTGHAVLAAASQIEGPFAVINADDFYGADSFSTLGRFLTEAREDRCLAVIGFRLAETLTEAGPVSRALLEVDDQGLLRGIAEALEVWRSNGRALYRDQEGRERTVSVDQRVSMNMWGFTPEVLPELRRRFADFLTLSRSDPAAEFLLPDVIHLLIREAAFHVEVLPGSSQWCGLTFREDHRRAQSIIASLIDGGRYPEVLWA